LAFDNTNKGLRLVPAVPLLPALHMYGEAFNKSVFIKKAVMRL